MTRIGFVLKVRPDLLEDYRRHHQAVWPEMLDALRRNGWRNYTLFLRPDGTLFGYFETEGSFEQALAGMAAEPVNQRWPALMGPDFAGPGRHADPMMEALDEVFHQD
jgi:L-rhamnose mutarotase